MRHVQHAADYGVIIKGEIGFDWDKIIKRSRGVADKLSGGVEFLFKKYGVTQILGTATLTGRGKIEVATTAAGKVTGKLALETPRTIIATGARAKFLPGIEPDGDRVITYREAMVLPEVPKSVVVIGAGAIGIEFADFWNAFGVEVTVIEYMPRVLPIEDEEISASLTRTLKKRKMTIHTGAKTTGVKVSGKTVTTSFTDADGKNQTVTSERVLLAVGVRANIENIGLEGMGVALDRGFIQVDDAVPDHQPRHLGDRRLRRPAAAGARRDGRGRPHRRGDGGQARRADQLRRDPRLHLLRPGGRVDRQDRGAGARGRASTSTIGKFPFAANGKALGAGHTDGFIKVITNKARGEIVGVHAIGYGVTDLIAEMSLAITSEATAHDVLAAVHPHPTLSEVMYEATAAALGEVVHI